MRRLLISLAMAGGRSTGLPSFLLVEQRADASDLVGRDFLVLDQLGDQGSQRAGGQLLRQGFELAPAIRRPRNGG